MKPFPFYKQPDAKDCGPTCLRIVAKHYSKSISLQHIRALSETTREGSSLLGLSEAAEHLGFKTLGVKVNTHTLAEEVPLPCILHWNKQHFVVLYKITNSKLKIRNFHISDPSYGLISYTQQEFLERWIGKNATAETEEGIALLLEPTPKFYQDDFADASKEQTKGMHYLWAYLVRYRQMLFQLVLGLLAGSLLALVFPFLTQSIVDVGIQNQDMHFVYLILVAQLMFFVGKTAIELIRSWILLHLSTRINISLVSDFFIKLMNLPIGFFDTRMTGDIIQRIGDHRRIEQLLTNTSLSTLFSFVNLIVFSHPLTS